MIPQSPDTWLLNKKPVTRWDVKKIDGDFTVSELIKKLNEEIPFNDLSISFFSSKKYIYSYLNKTNLDKTLSQVCLEMDGKIPDNRVIKLNVMFDFDDNNENENENFSESIVNNDTMVYYISLN